MRKCLLMVAAVLAMAAARTARGELLRYTLDVDSVYTSSARTTPIAYSGSGTNITLPAGTTSAYVTMAIVATVESPTAAANDISLDGFNMGILNIVANPLSGIGGATLATKFGKTASSAQQGPFINANDPNAAPVAGWNGQITGPASYTTPATLAATTVSAGLLQLGASNALPTNGPLTITGGSLDLGAFSVTTIDLATYRALATRAGGELTGDF